MFTESLPIIVLDTYIICIKAEIIVLAENGLKFQQCSRAKANLQYTHIKPWI